MSGFKVGDLVRCVIPNGSLVIHGLYKVTGLRPDGLIDVEAYDETAKALDSLDLSGLFEHRFLLVSNEVQVDTDSKWSFEITNEAQIDPTEFISSVNRKNPLLFVDDPNIDKIIAFVHTTLEYRMGTLGYDVPNYEDYVEFPNCTMLVLTRDNFSSFMKDCRTAVNTPLPNTGRRRVKVVLPKLRC